MGVPMPIKFKPEYPLFYAVASKVIATPLIGFVTLFYVLSWINNPASEVYSVGITILGTTAAFACNLSDSTGVGRRVCNNSVGRRKVLAFGTPPRPMRDASFHQVYDYWLTAFGKAFKVEGRRHHPNYHSSLYAYIRCGSQRSRLRPTISLAAGDATRFRLLTGKPAIVLPHWSCGARDDP